MGGLISYINKYIDDNLLLEQNYSKYSKNKNLYGVKILINFLEYIKENDNLYSHRSLIIKNKAKIIRKFYISGLDMGFDKNIIDRLIVFDDKLKEEVGNVPSKKSKKNDSKKNNNNNIQSKYIDDKKSMQLKYDLELKRLMEQESINRINDSNLFKKTIETIKDNYNINNDSNQNNQKN